MKDQYFGDVNDYRKYGLLRVLVEVTGLPLGVCWLRTEDDERGDGEERRYLEGPKQWRGYDPKLYDRLQRLRGLETKRDVKLARSWRLIPKASYFNDLFGDEREAREEYFAKAAAKLSRCPIWFLDPDNGLEVKKPAGRMGSCKYVYWAEIEKIYGQGHSLVIYQHFPRKPRDEFAEGLVQELSKRLSAPWVEAFATAHVLFLVVARPEHASKFRRAWGLIAERWPGQIVHAGGAYTGRALGLR